MKLRPILLALSFLFTTLRCAQRCLPDMACYDSGGDAAVSPLTDAASGDGSLGAPDVDSGDAGMTVDAGVTADAGMNLFGTGGVSSSL